MHVVVFTDTPLSDAARQMTCSSSGVLATGMQYESLVHFWYVL